MDPDADSLDILLSPATTAERTLGKFRPKTRPKIKASPAPSRLPDATQLLPRTVEICPHPPDLKCLEEKLNLPTSCIDGSFSNANQESVNQPEDSHLEPFVSTDDNVVALQGDQRESGEVADMFISMESLDYIELPSASARTVGRFQPEAKAQSKDKMLLTSTAVPSGIKSVGASTHCSSSSVSEAIPSEHHLTQEPCCLKETVVQVGVSMDKAQVSDSDASLQINPDKSQSDAMTGLYGLESVDDGIFLSSTTSEQTHGKFPPKLRPKTVKQVSAPSNSPDATQLISPTLVPLLHVSDVKCPDKGQCLPTISTAGNSTLWSCTSELHVSLESANQLVASHSEDLVIDGDIKEAKKLDQEKSQGVADMFSSMRSIHVDNHPTLTTGVAESLGTSNISSSSFAALGISSRVHIDQEPHNVEEDVVCLKASQDGTQVSKNNVNFHTHPEKPGAKAMELFSGIEYSDDIFFQPSTSAVEKVGKFQPKLISRPKNTKVKKVSFIPPDAAETVASPMGSHISFPQNEDVILACNSKGAEPSFLHMLSEGSLDDTPPSSITFSDYNGDIQMGHEKSGEEDTPELIGVGSLKNILSQQKSITALSMGKFQPKLSAIVKSVKPNIPVTGHGLFEPFQSRKDPIPTETVSLEGHAPVFPADSLVDPLSRWNCNSMPTDLAREQADHVDSFILDVAPPGSTNILLEKNNCVVGKAKSSSAEDITKSVQFRDIELTPQILDDRSTFKTVEDDGSSKSSMKLRKRVNTCSLSGGDKNSDDWDFDNNISEDDEEVPKQKRGPRKSKRQMSENEKPIRKRKKASEVPRSAVQAPVKKKFAHGTQRKKRQVNKVLLEAPEDEIDPRQLSLKDLIMLAEHKERTSNKEVIALRKSSPNQSTSSLPIGTHFDMDNPFIDEANQKIELSSMKLNYHSFMNRGSAKWSKSETDLFYQAIRQFGTDFAMIQKLFPQRTRHQMKLKFKNEERKHPMQVADALINRSKDHSHFELVIQKLQEEAEQNAYREVPDDPAAAALDAMGENEEERGWPDGAEEAHDWKGDVQSPKKLDEYDGFEWDANASYPQDMEKDIQ